MRSKQYFTSIKNNPHEISTDPNIALGRRNSIVRAIVRNLYRLTIKKAIVHILNTADFLKNPHLRVLASFTHLVVVVYVILFSSFLP